VVDTTTNRELSSNVRRAEAARQRLLNSSRFVDDIISARRRVLCLGPKTRFNYKRLFAFFSLHSPRTKYKTKHASDFSLLCTTILYVHVPDHFVPEQRPVLHVLILWTRLLDPQISTTRFLIRSENRREFIRARALN